MPSELSYSEMAILESVLGTMQHMDAIPHAVRDPAEWDRLAWQALGMTYPENSLMVQTLADLLYVNSPSPWEGDLE